MGVVSEEGPNAFVFSDKYQIQNLPFGNVETQNCHLVELYIASQAHQGAFASTVIQALYELPLYVNGKTHFESSFKGAEMKKYLLSETSTSFRILACSISVFLHA